VSIVHVALGVMWGYAVLMVCMHDGLGIHSGLCNMMSFLGTILLVGCMMGSCR